MSQKNLSTTSRIRAFSFFSREGWKESRTKIMEACKVGLYMGEEGEEDLRSQGSASFPRLWVVGEDRVEVVTPQSPDQPGDKGLLERHPGTSRRQSRSGKLYLASRSSG